MAEGPGRAESRAADRDDRRRTRQRVLLRVLGYRFSATTGAYIDERDVPGLATLERRVSRTRQLRINRRFKHPAVLRARGRAQRALLADLRERGLLAGGDACLACHEDDDLVAQCSRARGHAGNHRADFADDSHAAWGDDAPGAIPDDLTQFVPFEVAA